MIEPELSPDPVPAPVASDSISFDAAIALTQSLLDQMEQGTITDQELELAIATLVSTEDGARGFFVTYLPDSRSLPDQPSPAVVSALQSSPDVVAELLVKNLAMSAAMAILHRRNQNEVMAQGSDQVRSRTTQLIQQVKLPQVTERSKKLYESVVTGEGEYKAFLQRWNYDAEQRQAIGDYLSGLVNE